VERKRHCGHPDLALFDNGGFGRLFTWTLLSQQRLACFLIASLAGFGLLLVRSGSTGLWRSRWLNGYRKSDPDGAGVRTRPDSDLIMKQVAPIFDCGGRGIGLGWARADCSKASYRKFAGDSDGPSRFSRLLLLVDVHCDLCSSSARIQTRSDAGAQARVTSGGSGWAYCRAHAGTSR